MEYVRAGRCGVSGAYIFHVGWAGGRIYLVSACGSRQGAFLAVAAGGRVGNTFCNIQIYFHAN